MSCHQRLTRARCVDDEDSELRGGLSKHRVDRTHLVLLPFGNPLLLQYSIVTSTLKSFQPPEIAEAHVYQNFSMLHDGFCTVSAIRHVRHAEQRLPRGH